MSSTDKPERVDTASRVILATPRTLFRTFLDPETLVAWRAPDGMSARLHHFDPKIGGGYGLVLRHDEGASASAGKTRAREDEVEVKFLEFRPEECVVEEVHFISTDPAFAEPMRLTTTFEKDRDGTRVTLRAENVPSPISAENHKAGMLLSLGQLARLTE
ncbi:SRPBCC domain-containing protein [Sphingomonas oryzagri]|uniref:SRPBCC domain-containing protein n=1 Tax=Sphingomonas oryzagri TaxID=3042314 RepID=A0ABT6N1Q7_9SPHN|nr:SRPBCC domain-containing protein [Sphingomonas oryzagri]MDH7639209.1 SRPBCC domain-containing protein [Sphingomonas oryzagri]